ncbi:HPF/RaiA family ribosome-associated protein [Variovorax sp. J22P168]|uniref:HPF/RaiA family ribosome-associated protein n=1 Tax=Variovorax jilinensis TaxID=3053513 RepID=UPI0025765087|nr:HPF/RaiA family ribosome-associated protein [Variovorax sp. J22P168]MDM0011860.1 HPF/RaiA family ribosome-associated protein [Variovorax sp. J22P168]
MQIQVNTSNGIENKETLEQWADGEMRQNLSRFAGEVTRVEIHLSDENSRRGGAADKRCTMEARLAGHQPLAVSHDGATIDEAFRGASDKLKRSLDSTLGRLLDHRDRDSIRKDADAALE